MTQKLDREELKSYIGENVVVDTNGYCMYIGLLHDVGDHFIVLRDVDVHDIRDVNSTHERYILEACKYGVKKNRTEVLIFKREAVSLSRLVDIIPY